MSLVTMLSISSCGRVYTLDRVYIKRLVYELCTIIRCTNISYKFFMDKTKEKRKEDEM